MAQYGGEQYMKQDGHQTDKHVHSPFQSTTESQGIGATRTTIGTGAGDHGYEEGKRGGTGGGILHRTGSGSSSSEDDGEGGRRKKKGVVEKIKEKLPGVDHGCDEHKTSATTNVGGGGVGGYGNEGVESGHEKKGLMEKIKDKLPGVNQ